MIQSLCPTCEKPIVPGAGSVAKIRGMKVVTYCSAACAEGRVPPVAVSFPPPAPVAVAPAPPVPTPPASPAPSPAPLRSPAPAPRAAAVDEGWEELFEEPAALAEPVVGRRRNRGVMLVAGLALAAGAAVVASQFWPGAAAGSREEARPAEASGGPSPAALAGAAASTMPPSTPPRLDPGELYDRALGDLRSLMGSASPRVQRIAAMALARTKDQPALARLRGLLAAEKNPLVRVEIAYALARAGDPDGLGELHAALASQRRDARLDAARSLVQLGDHRGADQLRSFLSYTDYRIGAAGLLARIGDAKGTTALHQAIADRKKFPENEMRAVVALGAAGAAQVKPRLLEILRDGRYQVGAAQALAVLGDDAAVPSLVAQLDVDAFRVAAAVALRRMALRRGTPAAAAAPAPASLDLAPLAAALQGGNDVVRVTAAEAILVLTGPAALVERD